MCICSIQISLHYIQVSYIILHKVQLPVYKGASFHVAGFLSMLLSMLTGSWLRNTDDVFLLLLLFLLLFLFVQELYVGSFKSNIKLYRIEALLSSV